MPFAYSLLAALLAAHAGADWRLAGATYNSVAFVDVASVTGEGEAKTFVSLRISGQPKKDGWRNVVQKLSVNCATRRFDDRGSRIQQFDGSVATYPGFGAYREAGSRGVFFDMYQIVCAGRDARRVADPEAWTRANFKVG